MLWLATAPSNIALIKYMGKKDSQSNLPDNPSLSYTLGNLLSTVQLETISLHKDIWEPLDIPGTAPFLLSTKGQERFLQHLARLKQYFNYDGNFVVKSSNNFPHSSGLASSASSFAALTKCAVLALCELTQTPLLSIDEQAKLSRQGSGSSCRSFYAPWALWQEDEVKSVELPYKELLHEVIVISGKEKEVSSSDAHKRVKTSPLYATRSHKAEERLQCLLKAFMAKDWASAYTLCWAEFQDMHLLFSSCAEPFSYMTEKSLAVLKNLEHFWEKNGDGPLVTMDAGPNIHLLYRLDQAELASRFKQDYLVGHYDIL